MTPASPRFTVLLPTHNRADVVGLAIASVLAQTLADFEVLVVGDGCTDSTASVVDAFTDPRLRWLDLPKAPHFGYANRNLAMRDARGELVAFMAHDDLWLPDHLEHFAPLFDVPEVDWAYSRPAWVASNGIVVPFAIDLHDPDAFAVWMTDHNSVPAGNVVYRRRAHEWAGPWPEATQIGGDWELWRKIVGPSQGANLVYNPEVTQLHFRADWRKEGSWGPVPLGDWLALAESSWWPKELRVSVSDERAPQDVFAELVRPGSPWVPQMRAAARRLLDELAWRQATRLDEVEKQLARAGQRLANVTERKEIAEARLTQARSDVSAARQATSAAQQASNAAVARADKAEQELADRRRTRRNGILDPLRRIRRRVRLRLRPNPLFERAWYAATNADLAGAEPYRHWRDVGAAQERNPNPGFRTGWYVAQYPDVAASRLNPLDHYYVYGQLEGRAPAPPEAGAATQPLP
ncbi:MAG: glycosyltransferase family A protein [Chloroflexota bacterium]